MMRSPCRAAALASAMPDTSAFANEQFAVPSRAVVLPVTNPTEKTVKPAAAGYQVNACAICADRAEAARLNRSVTSSVSLACVDRTHSPYTLPRGPSAAQLKKDKQACVIIPRVAPEPAIHARACELGVQRAHLPYVFPAGWDGECIGQDICTMLGAGNCICPVTEDVPKCRIACLDWVNRGVCDPTKRGLATCPFAHPDLTEVHPDICCNYFLTGICRFRKTAEEEAVAAAADPIEIQKKKRTGRSRGPSDCMGCHCVAPADGVFPLLPGLTKKILRPLRTEGTGTSKKVVEWDRTDLDRALALYKAYLAW